MTLPPSPSGSALLVIDLQLGMFNGERLATARAPAAFRHRESAAIESARSTGVPVIYVRHAGRPGHPLEHGTPNWHIHPAIAPQGRERIIDKRTPDSFHETSLIADLAAKGINRLLIMGAQTELCVDTTCRRACSLGFNVTLVSDAHSTWDNATLTVDQIIRHTNDTLNGWFVRLIRVNEVGGSLQNC